MGTIFWPYTETEKVRHAYSVLGPLKQVIERI